MDTKMKGLLKGLRYISQIFDSKEPEMQIGFPTDVKHVAHIGWDNQPSNNGPNWMTGEPSPRGTSPGNWPPSGYQNDYQGRELTQDKQRPPRRNSSGDTASPKHDMSTSNRQTQRRHSSSSNAGGYGDPSYQVESNDGSGKNMKSRSIAGTSDSSQPDVPAVPKQNRRRKTKGSSGGGSGKSKSKSGVPVPELEVDDEVAMTNFGAVLATNNNR